MKKILNKINNMSKRNKIILGICSIFIIGAVIGVGINLIKTHVLKVDVNPIQSNLMIYKDFTDTMDASDTPYSSLGLGKNYFPMIYVVMRILSFFNVSSILIYFISFIAFTITLIVFYLYILKNKIKNSFLATLIMGFFIYPMWFLFQRANVEYFVLVALIVFIVQFKRERYYWAAFALAIAVGMKLYPALFALLFLKRKQYKPFFCCTVLSLRCYNIRIFHYGW